jgi:hypothetical protein
MISVDKKNSGLSRRNIGSSGPSKEACWRQVMLTFVHME